MRPHFNFGLERLWFIELEDNIGDLGIADRVHTVFFQRFPVRFRNKALQRLIPGIASAKVDLVWDPPWDKDRISEAAKLQLGFL